MFVFLLTKTVDKTTKSRNSDLFLHIHTSYDASGFVHMTEVNLALEVNFKIFPRKISNGENWSRVFLTFLN